MFSKAVLTNLFIYLFIYFIISVCSQLGDLGPTNRSLLFLNVFFYIYTYFIGARNTRESNYRQHFLFAVVIFLNFNRTGSCC